MYEILKITNNPKITDTLYLKIREVEQENSIITVKENLVNSKENLKLKIKEIFKSFLKKGRVDNYYFREIKDNGDIYLLILNTVKLEDNYFKIMFFEELTRLNLKTKKKYISKFDFLSKIVYKETLMEFLKEKNYIEISEKNLEKYFETL
jgi:hypothetical protein